MEIQAESQLEPIGICSGKVRSGTCFITESACVVTTSAHLILDTNKTREFFEHYLDLADGDLMFTRLYDNFFFDKAAFEKRKKRSATSSPDFETSRRKIFSLFFKRDEQGRVIYGDPFFANKLIYLNPACDVAVLNIEPKKIDDRLVCPGDGLIPLKFPDEQAYRLLINNQSKTFSKDTPIPGSKKPILSLTGFPTLDGVNQESSLYSGKTESYRIKTNSRIPESVVSNYCDLIHHKITSFEGNSGGPYRLGHRSSLVGLHWRPALTDDNEFVNEGVVFRPSLSKKILELIAPVAMPSPSGEFK